MPKGARVAYAKFMTKKIQQDFTEENKEEAPSDTTCISKPSVKFKGIEKNKLT